MAIFTIDLFYPDAPSVPAPNSVILRSGFGYCYQSVGTGTVTIKGSNDGSAWFDIVTLTNNDVANLMHFCRYLQITTSAETIKYLVVRGY